MTAEKRNQLIFLFMVTSLVMALLYLTLISGLQSAATRARNELTLERVKLETLNRQESNMEGVLLELGEGRVKLEDLEQHLPEGEAYSWFLERIDGIAQRQGVERRLVDRPVWAADVPLSSKDYGVLRGSCEVIGVYGALGVFVAAVENELPFAQIEELRIGSSSGRAVVSVDGESPPLLLRMRYACLAPRGSAKK